MQFVLGTQDHPSKVGAALEVVDHYAFNLCSKRPQNVSQQIVRQRTLLVRPGINMVIA